jgi:hypothetical protein
VRQRRSDEALHTKLIGDAVHKLGLTASRGSGARDSRHMESFDSGPRGMDARLARAMRGLHGALGGASFTLSEAQSAGVGRGSLSRLVAVGALVRVARGMYVVRHSEHPWIDRLRGLLEGHPEIAACRVTAARLTAVAIPPDHAVRHRRAAGESRTDPGRMPPKAGQGTPGCSDRLHLCGIDGFDVPHWRVPGVEFARMSVPASHVIEAHPGIRVTDPIRTALDLARGRDLACALVPLDSVLRQVIQQGFPPHVARSIVGDRCDEMGSAPGVRAVRRALGFMHAGAETALESLVRGRLIDAGIEGIRVQLLLAGASGHEYRVDLGLEKAPGRFVIIEADGLGKYAVAADLAKEKLRQHDLESAGHGVVRVVYREAAYEPSGFIARVRSMLAP